MKIRRKLLLVLIAIVGVSSVLALVGSQGWLLFVVSVGSILMLTSAAYLVVGRLTRSIERMADAVNSMDPRVELPYEGRDELGMLALSVHRMKSSLLGKIHELQEERRLLASVVSGIREGLLVVGPDRRVRLANEAFLQIFGLPFEPAGRLLVEVIRDPTVIRDLDAALQDRRVVRETVVHAADSGRVFELHVTPLEPRGTERDGGALVLFFDVSRLEALENVRREFVADVSHELRTPLTSIKAFVETLIDGGVKDVQTSLRFLAIVRNHADRMNALIDDLTNLSLIETGSVTLDVRTMDAAEIVEDVIAQLGPKQAKLGVAVRSEVPVPFPLRADRRRLEQILLNVVDNGIKFNRPGGSVRVEAAIREGRPVLVVEDSGVGIPSDSLEKVFHRFYRVDKARSKETGGTGLGLSIVKHLMRLHGGQVRIESEIGRGSRVVLEFPAPGTMPG